MEVNQIAIERMVQTAKDCGCPKDQVENFLTRGYVPFPWQWKFHSVAREADKVDGPTDIGVGGARGPGKSHGVLAQVALDDLQRRDGLKGLFLRQTGISARESFEDLIGKILVGKIAHKFNRAENILTFPNKSRVVLGGFQDEKDIDRFIGIEYDLMVVEELTQVSENKILKLKGSLRTSRTDWRPRFYASFNPGGIGHEFVKKTFILSTDPRVRFVPATFKDNPYLNIEYVEYLGSLGGSLGKAWREGNWDIFEGQYFTEFDRNKHVVDAFGLPDHWPKFRSIDPSGRSGITSCHWYCLDHDGNVIVYREYYKTGLDADEHADNIKRMSEGEDYKYTTIDTSAFSKLGLPETIAEVYIRHGVSGLLPASKDRVAGWNSVHTYLRWSLKGGPRLRIFLNCPELIRTLPLAIHDELHPEDVDSRCEDHAIDELRYFLQTIREQKSAKPLSFVERKLLELKEREEQIDYSYARRF